MKRVMRWIAGCAAAVAIANTATAAAAPGTADELLVQIVGPSTVPENKYCSWFSSVSGGTPPYTYEWIPQGTQAPGGQYSFRATWDFWLDLRVTDANGLVGFTYRYITVTGSTGDCMI